MPPVTLFAPAETGWLAISGQSNYGWREITHKSITRKTEVINKNTTRLCTRKLLSAQVFYCIWKDYRQWLTCMTRGLRVRRHVDREALGWIGSEGVRECSSEHDAKTPRLSTWRLPLFALLFSLPENCNLGFARPRSACRRYFVRRKAQSHAHPKSTHPERTGARHGGHAGPPLGVS